jgi:hypothetical protein
VALPTPLIWVAFTLANFIPYWPLRAAVIWGGIYLPLVVLSASVDYARVHGGGFGFHWPFRRKRKKKDEDEEEYYEQKSAIDALIEAST